MAKRDVLKEIVVKKKEKILLKQQQLPQEELKAAVRNFSPPRAFIEAINKPRQISLIAEIKKASPSRGIIRQDFNPQEIAKIYQDVGVQAISVLTEEDFFMGSLKFINEVKAITSVPILRKDFILEPYQVYESRYFGADAILLIADLLTRDNLTQLMQIAKELGMDCLVEVHDEKELKKVLNLKVPLIPNVATQRSDTSGSRRDTEAFTTFGIGINNRDLHTLEVDFKITEKLFTLIPKDKVVVVESGIKNYQDVLFLKILGVSAILVGEAFMEVQDIRKKMEEMMGW